MRGNPGPQEASLSSLGCDVVVVPPTHFMLPEMLTQKCLSRKPTCAVS